MPRAVDQRWNFANSQALGRERVGPGEPKIRIAFEVNCYRRNNYEVGLGQRGFYREPDEKLRSLVPSL